MVWTAPYGIAMCQNEVVEISDKGAVREPDYPNWNGYVEAFFSAAWIPGLRLAAHPGMTGRVVSTEKSTRTTSIEQKTRRTN